MTTFTWLCFGAAGALLIVFVLRRLRASSIGQQMHDKLDAAATNDLRLAAQTGLLPAEAAAAIGKADGPWSPRDLENLTLVFASRVTARMMHDLVPSPYRSAIMRKAQQVATMREALAHQRGLDFEHADAVADLLVAKFRELGEP